MPARATSPSAKIERIYPGRGEGRRGVLRAGDCRVVTRTFCQTGRGEGKEAFGKCSRMDKMLIKCWNDRTDWIIHCPERRETGVCFEIIADVVTFRRIGKVWSKGWFRFIWKERRGGGIRNSLNYFSGLDSRSNRASEGKWLYSLFRNYN